MALQPGQVISGQFRLERPLGKGGMGEVWIATQLTTGRARALKLMSAELGLDPRACERFVEEARTSARIPSDHVVEVVGAGMDPATGAPWMAMELLDGEDLAHVIASRGALPPDEVATLFEQLGHGLGAAHEQGIVHRDLKPENVFLARPRRVGATAELKLLDFGVAAMLGDDRSKATVTTALGTPLWWAPEQMQVGEHVRPATDVWALGLLAFHVLTGHFYWRTPYAEGASVARIVTEILTEPLSPASVRARELGVAASLPAGFDDWMAACVVRDPKARFGSARAAVSALLPLLRAPRRAHRGSVAFAATEHLPAPRVASAAAPVAAPAPTPAAASAPAVAPRRSDPEPARLAQTLPEAGPPAAASARSRGWLVWVGTLGTLGLAGTAAVVALAMQSQRAPSPPPIPRREPAPPSAPSEPIPTAVLVDAGPPTLALAPTATPTHRITAPPPREAAPAAPAPSEPVPPVPAPAAPSEPAAPAISPFSPVPTDPAPARPATTIEAPAPAPPAPRRVVVERSGATRLVGNAEGGDPYDDACPTGEAVVGLEGNSIPYLGRLRVVCGELNVPDAPGRVRVGRVHALASRGRNGGEPTRVTCPDDQVVVGYDGRSGLLVDRLALRCAPLTLGASGEVEVGAASSAGAVGGSGGTPFGTVSCPGETIGRGARVRAGDGIDAFSLTCGDPTLR